MAQGKSDLPEDLLSLKPSDRSWTGKVDSLGGNDEKIDDSKDQMGSESSIPLSPQWLYAKPSETKMDSRGPPSVSLGNPPDPNQKEAWRLDASQDRKDWRKIVTENENTCRWREEERETGLLSGRRDRRKGERRAENVPSRETTDNRAMSSSDRWHDSNIRNTAHESRRDNKWSSRWGPEEKEKESHTTEKRTDTEKEKDDAHNENQSFVSSNRPTSDRDPESSRDKWRPRHRMEVHSGGSTASRAAPGFGLERGKVESHTLGFAVGRGRGRSSSASCIGVVRSLKDESVPGKPKFLTATFCYPRGKLLDIYRWQKLDNPSFAAIPDGMVPTITQVGLVEPMAFVPPDSEEEGILNDIWKGKITGSGVVYNSFRQGRTSGNVSEIGEQESTEAKQDMLSHILTGETVDILQEAIADVPYKALSVGSSSNNEMSLNLVAGKEVTNEEEFKVSFGALQSNSDDVYEKATSFDINEKITDETSSLFLLGSSDENHSSNGHHMASDKEAESLGLVPEELTLFYIDPQGNTQGPFLGADIISWFKRGFFGTDLLVRLADSPEETPFQELGVIMPYLKVEDKHANSEGLNYMLEQSGSLGGKLEAVHNSGPNMKSTESCTEKLFQASSTFSGLSAQCMQSRISEPEAILQPQPQQSEGQSFEDFVAQDEEIVFPGRSGNAYPIAKSSRSIHSSLMNSSSHPSLSNELTEISMPNENDSKLHRFGLLWSELEGPQTRHTQSSNVPSGVVRSTPFSAMVDPVLAGETWSDIYGKHTFPDSNNYQDALAAAHMSRLDHEPNHFDLTEQLMSQQLQQQQLHPQHIFSHARLNESLLEHLPSQNLIHQRQLSDHSALDLEHLLALQMQQRQLQFQQQFHQEQKLLQEHQQSQVRQALLEQLLCGQMPAPGLGQSVADPIRSGNVLDQVLLEQQLLHELQQQSHHASRNFVPPLDQLVQAKFGQTPLEEHQRDLYELISNSQHGQMQSLEHQFLQKQQLQRQLSMGLKQHNEEREINSMWPADSTNQFPRNSAGINRVQSSGFSPLDLYQQQRPAHEEQLSHLERNLSMREQLWQGLYEQSSSPFERSMSLPVGASGINMDVVNAMAHARNLDVDEPSTHLQSAGQVGTFSPGLHAHNPHHLVPNHYNPSQHAIEGHWVENNGQVANDWMESQIQQLHINAERQKRDLGVKMPSEKSSSWMSDGLNDDKSRQLLMELLHQKSGHPTTESLERAPSRFYLGSSSLDNQFSVLAEQEAGLNNSIPAGSYGSSSSEAQQVYLADEPTGSFESDERLQFRPGSGVISEGERFLSRNSNNAQSIYRDTNMMKGLVFEVNDGTIKHGGLTSIGERDNPVNVLNRHSSLAVAGGNTSAYSNQIGLINSYVEDVAMDRVQVPDRVQDNMLPRRAASSSQEGFLEFVSDPASRGKNSLISGNDGGKQDQSGNIGNQGSDTIAKKEIRFRRTSSYGEGEVSEASFIDMLKSNSKKSAVPEAHVTAGTGAESLDGTQGGRSSKKKGKKGRQIDPALLGFKVTSNRIMMGEIQRVED